MMETQNTQFTADRLETFMQGKLHRFDCPPLDLLRDYTLAMLEAPAADQIATHLDWCPRCREEVTTIKAALETEAVTVEKREASRPGLLTQIKDVFEDMRVTVATLVTPLAPSAAGVGLRGTSAHEPMSLLYEANDDAINLLVDRASDSITPTVTVDGQLFSGAALAAGEAMATLTAVDMTRPPIHREIDITGNFTFQQLTPGDYQLRIKTADQQIVVPLVQL